MNKQIIKTLNRLCGETETLQSRTFKYSGMSQEARQCHEMVARAKDALISAIRCAEAAEVK